MLYVSLSHANFCQCCSPLDNGDGGWGIFNSLFGWQNSATYGSVISYNLYWLVVIVSFLYLGYQERSGKDAVSSDSHSEASDGQDELTGKKHGGEASAAVREVSE
jgi:high-affinity iron transporter